VKASTYHALTAIGCAIVGASLWLRPDQHSIGAAMLLLFWLAGTGVVLAYVERERERLAVLRDRLRRQLKDEKPRPPRGGSGATREPGRWSSAT
jgi:hypothetical protein